MVDICACNIQALFTGKTVVTTLHSIENIKWAVHKIRSQSKGFVQCEQGGGRVFQMRMSALFGANNFGFFEIGSVSARTGEFEPVRIF